MQAQDDERRRISRDLHDRIGQYLTAAKMSVNAWVRACNDGAHDGRQYIKEILGTIDAAIAEVRTASYLLYPPMLDELGLGPALRWYAEDFTKCNGIHLDVAIPADLPRLPNDTEIALFRVVQECLTNVHRYSRSARAWIRITVRSIRLRLEVKDEGKGIATQDLANRVDEIITLGVGIPGMRERLRELGGGLTIRSSEHGTQVIATLPLARKQTPSE